MVRAHKHSGLSQKKVTKLIDKRILVKKEKKVKLDLTVLNIDGSADVTLGTAFEDPDMLSSVQTISEGTGEGDRIGDELTLVAYKIRYHIFTSDTNARLLIVYFPNSDGADFAAAMNTIGTSSLGFLPRKEDFSPGYKVLYDRNLRFDSSEEVPKVTSVSLKVKGLTIKYLSGGNISSGAIRAYIVSNVATEGGSMGDIRGAGKLYWTD